jgi:hypothetical protein
LLVWVSTIFRLILLLFITAVFHSGLYIDGLFVDFVGLMEKRIIFIESHVHSGGSSAIGCESICELVVKCFTDKRSFCHVNRVYLYLPLIPICPLGIHVLLGLLHL